MSVEFSSPDGRFHVELHDGALEAMLDAARSSFPKESGGILTGYYRDSLRTAVVEQATAPTPDSKHSRTRFYRGVAGLQEFLRGLWRRPADERRYYLGEWHVHPGGAPTPSGGDRSQMQKIAESEDYQCPEAVLLLLGGDPHHDYVLAVWIFRKNQKPLELRRRS